MDTVNDTLNIYNLELAALDPAEVIPAGCGLLHSRAVPAEPGLRYVLDDCPGFTLTAPEERVTLKNSKEAVVYSLAPASLPDEIQLCPHCQMPLNPAACRCTQDQMFHVKLQLPPSPEKA